MSDSAPASLIHYPDSAPGITRKRCGRGFRYIAPDGTAIDDPAEKRRLAALAVPPAYERVWICPLPHGHLQATGFDARARKQYRYHPDWRAWREATKYDRLADFGAALPAIRRRIRHDLAGDPGDRAFAIAAILAMIDRLSMRVGTGAYAADNGTFGATTLTGRHLTLTDDGLRLSYRAKGGLRVRKVLRDQALARALGHLHDLPGRTLVSWQDTDGTPRAVLADEVNATLARITGESGHTAKTFRTWAGSEAALAAALSAEDRPTIKAMAQAAADRLHNTPGIARNSYIHPRVIALSDASPGTRGRLTKDLPEQAGLRHAERALLRLLA